MEISDSIDRDYRLASSSAIADPSSAIRARFGPIRFADEDFVAADRVIEELAADARWFIPEKFANLQAEWEARNNNNTMEAVKKVRAIAHDLSGIGDTVGYPMVTILARSLCRFIDLCNLERRGAYEMIDAHIAALDAVVKKRMSCRREGMADTIATAFDSALKRFR